MPRKQCRGWVEIHLIVESETGRKGGEDGGKGKKKEEEWKWHRLSRALLSFSIIHPYSPAVLHPLLHPAGALLVSLGTLAFYRQRALTFEARGSRRRRRGLRRWKVSAARGGKGGWWTVEIEKKREKGRLSARGGRQAIEGTVGALNPFKYNQYRWEGAPSTLSVIWIWFLPFIRVQHVSRARMHAYVRSPLSAILWPREIFTSFPFLPIFFIKNSSSRQRNAPWIRKYLYQLGKRN